MVNFESNSIEITEAENTVINKTQESDLNLVEPKRTSVEDQLTEPETNKNTLSVFINPVQMFILSETVKDPSFIEVSNTVIKKVNEGRNSFFGFEELFSGDFAGVFTELKPLSQNQADLDFNLGAALINLFVASVLNGGRVSVESPVGRESVKAFLQDPKNAISKL